MVAGGFPTPHPQLCIVSRNISEGSVISSQTQSERENTLQMSFRAEWGRLSQGRELKIKEVPGSGQGRIWDEISLAPKSIIYILCTVCVYMYVCAHMHTCEHVPVCLCVHLCTWRSEVNVRCPPQFLPVFWGRVLWNICVHCTKMCHGDWFSRELNSQ